MRFSSPLLGGVAIAVLSTAVLHCGASGTAMSQTGATTSLIASNDVGFAAACDTGRARPDKSG